MCAFRAISVLVLLFVFCGHTFANQTQPYVLQGERARLVITKTQTFRQFEDAKTPIRRWLGFNFDTSSSYIWEDQFKNLNQVELALLQGRYDFLERRIALGSLARIQRDNSITLEGLFQAVFDWHDIFFYAESCGGGISAGSITLEGGKGANVLFNDRYFLISTYDELQLDFRVYLA